MPVTQELKVQLQRVIFKGALKGAHRYSRSVNPHKIPFFLLGGDSCRRYEALGWREKIVYRALQRRWDAKGQGNM
jgi:hypothetical protein